ncbi:hypothetical protein ABPG72_018755 [Tetrahymena utriculariae]
MSHTSLSNLVLFMETINTIQITIPKLQQPFDSTPLKNMSQSIQLGYAYLLKAYLTHIFSLTIYPQILKLIQIYALKEDSCPLLKSITKTIGISFRPIQQSFNMLNGLELFINKQCLVTQENKITVQTSLNASQQKNFEVNLKEKSSKILDCERSQIAVEKDKIINQKDRKICHLTLIFQDQN